MTQQLQERERQCALAGSALPHQSDNFAGKHLDSQIAQDAFLLRIVDRKLRRQHCARQSSAPSARQEQPATDVRCSSTDAEEAETPPRCAPPVTLRRAHSDSPETTFELRPKCYPAHGPRLSSGSVGS